MYSWGLGTYGQLGNGKNTLKQYVPMIINEEGAELNDNGEEMSNPTALVFPKEKIRKYLPNILITPGFDCTFLLVSKPYYQLR